MKIIKGLFFFLAALILAGCLGILICALTPSLTERLAERVEQMGFTGSNGSGGWQQDGGDMPTDNAVPEGIRPELDAGRTEDSAQSGYELPEEPVEAPSSVSGRTGYEPVQEEAEEIAEDEADNLTESAGLGNTGSDLSFPEEYYPYYAMLEDDMQQLYRQIYANALELNKSFAPVVPVTVNRLKTVFEAVYNDHPELFWLETGYSCKYLRSGDCVEITLKYNATADNLDQAKQNFDRSAGAVLAGAQALGSTLEKEQYVHDSLMGSIAYDMNAPMNQSAYSALVQGRTVCAGYARAFQYLMQQLGVPCYYCTGYAGEDHAWNIMNLDGTYYNVDVTWDDTDPATYDYFNKSDRQFGPTHVRTGLSVYLPACLEDTEDMTAPAEDTDDGAAQDLSDYTVEDLINPDPIEPLVWRNDSVTDSVERDDESQEPAEGRDGSENVPDGGNGRSVQENLEEAGITADEVCDDMEEYYEDCLELLKKVGTGDQQFINVIPDSLWNSVERAYNTGAYWEGYAEEALKELGADNFVIQIQAERLGGGYYRLYHNVYTY